MTSGPMPSINFLYLSMQDVIDVGLTFGEAVDIVEDVFREHGAKQYENPPKPGVHPRDDAFIHAMPGYLVQKKAVGLKWVSGFSSNPIKGLPTIMGLIILNDVETGQPIAAMDGAYITALRTAAASGVSARYLANEDCKVIGLVGAGIQGRYHLLTLNEVLSGIEHAKVFDTNNGVLERFVATMDEMLPFKLEAGRSAEDVIKGADIVVTATGKLDQPIFEEQWVKEGALLLPVHTRGWEVKMLDRADKLVTDDWAQFCEYAGPPHGFYSSLPDPYFELGEIIVGTKPGRESRSERIINFNVGIAIHDVAMASVVLDRARQNGKGTTLTLMDRALPFS